MSLKRLSFGTEISKRKAIPEEKPYKKSKHCQSQTCHLKTFLKDNLEETFLRKVFVW